MCRGTSGSACSNAGAADGAPPAHNRGGRMSAAPTSRNATWKPSARDRARSRIAGGRGADTRRCGSSPAEVGRRAVSGCLDVDGDSARRGPQGRPHPPGGAHCQVPGSSVFLPERRRPVGVVVAVGPLSSVKEQAAGAYAQAMAERGYGRWRSTTVTSARAMASRASSRTPRRTSRTSGTRPPRFSLTTG
jgi:hypothetical protein